MFRRTLVLVLCLVAIACPDGALAIRASAVGPEQAAAPGASLPPASTVKTAIAADPTPSRLLIPRIGVNARIEARGLDAYRNMLTPRDYHDVAWYNLGPRPGSPGNALINGHVDWWTGAAVFTRLSELKAGDRVIVVRADGTRLTFKVTGSSIVGAGARVASLFAPGKSARLTLITCAGVWDPRILTNTQRLLVSAVLA